MFSFLTIFFFSSFAYAGSENFSYTYDGFLAGDRRKIEDVSVEDSAIQADQRLDLRWTAESRKFILRPRWLLTSETRNSETTSKGKADITTAFWEQSWGDQETSVITTTGLQVYQWGPAEIINVSNPFFHFNSSQKSLIFLEKGKVILRANWNPHNQASLVFLLEPISNNEESWISEKDFYPQAAVKLEKLWLGTRNNLGGIVGKSDDAAFFVGGYAEYEFQEGWTIFSDVKHSHKKEYFAPEKQTLFYDMRKVEDSAQMIVLGIRYEGDFDIRSEYFYNSAGYGSDDYDHALQAAVFSPKRFAKPGLEFLRKNYLYTSFRKANLFDLEDFNLYVRNMSGLEDQSGLWQAETDKSIHDNFLAFASVSAAYGKRNSEFRLLVGEKISLGAKLVF